VAETEFGGRWQPRERVFGTPRYWAAVRKPQYLILIVITVGIAIGCIFAGVWQIHRYDWKHGSNDLLRRNDVVPAVPAAELLSTDHDITKDLQFRRVTARGVFEPQQQLLVRNREVNNSPALLVLTPLRTDAGPTLLVVRGWVPMTQAADQTPSVPAPPSGEVSVTARVYPSEPALPERALPAGQVDRLNVPDITAQIGQPTYGAYAELIDASATSALAQLPPPDMDNPTGGAFEWQHLAYVGQWFIFALLALGAPFLLARIDVLRQDSDGASGGDESPAESAERLDEG
jgi:cytochrome oxidase assembly protein ShyY1